MTADAGQPAVAFEGRAEGTARAASRDASLRDRARRVIPGGMYGHQNAANWPAEFPQFLERGRGCRIWDVDGREYLDFVCSFGPIVLGHAHPVVEAAVERQRGLADCQNGPSPRMVELAERLVDLVPHADWAMFAEERHRCHDARPLDRARGDGPAEGPGRPRRLSWLGAVVHAAAGGDDTRGPRPPDPVRLQRPGERRGRRGPGRRRPRGGAGVGVPPRRALRPGGVRSGVRARDPGALRSAGRGARPRRRARRLPAPPRRELGAAGRAPRPLRVQQGHRQRLPAGGRRRPGLAPRRRAAGVRDRVLLVRRRADGRRARDDRGARDGAGHRADGSRRDAPPRGARPSGADARAPDPAERARSSCRS